MIAFRFAGELDGDPPELAAVWERGCRGVMQDGGDVVAFFDRRIDLPVEGQWEPVDEVDWLEAYFAGLQPVDTGPIVVAPTHGDVTLRAGQKALWLDPGTAFGTGHHETTQLILRAMGRRDLFGRRVLDVGSGSGILAIAADLLGAQDVVGVDNDEATVPVAEVNARRNRSRARFHVGVLTTHGAAVACGDPVAGPWQLLVANLFAELHADLMPSYAAASAPGAELLLSGIAGDRLTLVLDALPPELVLVERSEDGPWHLLELRRT